VDQDTFESRVVSATAACEIGTPVHPLLAQGQIEGGILQGIGYGLMEEIKTEQGRYLNDRLSTYLIPTIKDAPAMDVLLIGEESGRARVAPKGAGELPMDGAAPAVAAAIENAMGLSVSALPLTPDRLSAAPAIETQRTVAMGGGM
jgi:CO/xanthine dehydrogenase Mo-binding subunit